MATTVEKIEERLLADSTLLGVLGLDGYAGILQGGLYTRPLKAEGRGSTPTAFYTSAEKGRLVRPSAVIVDRGDVPHPQQFAVPTAINEFPLIYFYAPAHDSGKAAINDARERVFDLLNEWSFVTENGPVAFVKYVDRVGILDSEEFIGAVFDYCRYQVTTRLRNAV